MLHAQSYTGIDTQEGCVWAAQEPKAETAQPQLRDDQAVGEGAVSSGVCRLACTVDF